MSYYYHYKDYNIIQICKSVVILTEQENRNIKLLCAFNTDRIGERYEKRNRTGLDLSWRKAALKDALHNIGAAVMLAFCLYCFREGSTFCREERG
jgi:hypothetical protein